MVEEINYTPSEEMKQLESDLGLKTDDPAAFYKFSSQDKLGNINGHRLF